MRNLVDAYLERIPADAFVKFQDAIKNLASKRYGVYSLYKGGKLYYVGLAKNLKSRVQQHLKDQHKGKWDSFSLYLVRHQEHMKDLETLVIHIAAPAGNTMAGKFSRSVNLRPKLKKLALESVKSMFVHKDLEKSKKAGIAMRPKVSRRNPKSPPLKGIFVPDTRLMARHKKREYEALVDADGRLTCNGTVFNSPSAAAIHITGGPKDGWLFWRFQNAEGKWVLIDEARKKG